MCHYAGLPACVVLTKINRINDVVLGFGGAATYVNTISTVMAHPTAI